jgi:hypothetical protein
MLSHTMNNNIDYVANWVINYGKYRGQTYGWIWDNDPNYARWLYTVTKSERVKEWLYSKMYPPLSPITEDT